MLVARNLHCNRGRRQVLSGIDLSLHAGEVIGVLGANGAGKSTLLGALAGEITVPRATVSLNGRDLLDWPVEALARTRAVLPQSPGLNFDLDVTEVIGMGGYPFPELDRHALDALLRRALELLRARLDAVRSFREAWKRDPDCAICYWGEGWAWGSYLNGPMPADQSPFAYAAMQKAVSLRDKATPKERAFIDALSVRYVKTFRSEEHTSELQSH